MTGRLLGVVAVVSSLAALIGCAREVKNPTPRPAELAAPISTLQVAELLSPNVEREEGNLFVTAEPDRCGGLAREVDPPFLDIHRPMATDGGHWTTSDGRTYVEEMVAVFRFDFDPAAALDVVRQAIETCRETTLTVTTMRGRTYAFAVMPAAAESPQGRVGWSLHASDWNCGNTFVAAYNAAIEITACGTAGGFDVAALADDALKRIEAVVNTTA